MFDFCGLGYKTTMHLFLLKLVIILVCSGYLYYYSSEEWMGSDYVHYTTMGKMAYWTDSDYGYTGTQFGYLALEYLLEPVCIVSTLLLALLFFKSKVNILIKLVLIGAMFSTIMYWAIYNVKNYTYGILACGVFCFGDYNDETDIKDFQEAAADDFQDEEPPSGYKIAYGLGNFFAAISVAALLMFMLVRLLWDSFEYIYYGGVIGDDDDDVEDNQEGERLLNGGETDIDAATSNATHKTVATRERFGELAIYMILVFLLWFPFNLFMSACLPNQFNNFTPSGIAISENKVYYAEKEDWPIHGTYYSLTINSDLTLVFWPDVLLFYGFIYIIAVIGLLAQVSDSVKYILLYRPSLLWNKFVSMGEIFLVLLFITLLALEFVYWEYDHLYHWQKIGDETTEDYTDKTWQESLARTFGQLANVTIGLLILPVSRNNIFEHTFGVSWDNMLKYHQYLGYLFLLLIALHMSFFIDVITYQEGDGSIFNIPLDYNGDNFTIPLALWTYLISLLIFGVGTFWWIRRHYFEVFYFSHHWFLVLFSVVLLHATSSWYFLVAGLTLWVADRGIRFIKGTSAVKVVECIVTNDKFTTLSYIVEGGGKGCWSKLYEPLACEMGQYAFINFPQISPLEWHPFSISSSPADPLTTHTIKSMGEGTWTNDLLKLASQHPKGKGLQMNVDGPYGLPINHKKYLRLVLVAGGIGITPLHSIARSLYILGKQGHAIPTIHLIWIVKDASMFELFGNTIESMLDDNLGNQIDVSLFYTEAKENKGKNYSKRFPAAQGRPQLHDMMAPYRSAGMKNLVYACGPQTLIDDAAEVSQYLGLSFHSESFEL